MTKETQEERRARLTKETIKKFRELREEALRKGERKYL